jgi:SSS family solute:Na+ symporter
VIASIPVAILLKLSIIDLPFMEQMFYTTLITMVIIMGVSLTSAKEGVDDDEKAISLVSSMFKTGRAFNISAYLILLILAFLYTFFW